MYKQVIVVRDDLKLSIGKLVAQCCHATLIGYRNASRLVKKIWEIEGEKKVILRAKDLDELKSLKEKADELRVKAFFVRDAGLTEVKPGTITCLVLGPDKESKIDKVTGHLKLLK